MKLTAEEIDIILIQDIVSKKINEHFKKKNWLNVKEFEIMVKEAKQELKDEIRHNKT